MKKLMLIMILLVCPFTNILFAGWERTYGGASDDEAFDIIPALDGGYLVTGRTESYGFGSDGYTVIYLFKIDTLGNMEWSKTYGYPDKSEEGEKLIPLPDGYILSGIMYSPESDGKNMFIMKLNESGDSLWTRYYGGTRSEELDDIILTADRGFLLVGQTYSFGAGSYGDAYIVRTDSLGDTLWTKRIGKPAWLESAYSAIQTPDGDFIISMIEWPLGTGYEDLILLKLDNSGDSVWVKKYAGPYHDWGKRIVATSDGNYVVSGAYGTATYFYDWWLLKIDDSGDTLWTKTFSGYPRFRGENIKLMPGGGFIAINSLQSTEPGVFDICLIRLDSGGNILWDVNFGGTGHDLGESVILTPDGGFAIAGEVSSFGDGDYDCFVAKLDSLGSSTVDEKKTLPMVNKISAYPNPFNSAVTISLSGGVGASNARSGQVGIEIYDISGRLVADLPVTNCGEPQFVPTPQIWRPDKSLGSGVYLVRAKIGNSEIRKRIVYLK